MKNERKIREYLGNRYHLFVEYKSQEEIIWKVYRKYEGWMFDNSKPVLEGDKSTEDELLKFAKKHRSYDERIILSKSMIVIACINLIVATANCFLKIEGLRHFISGVNFTIILLSFIKMRVSSKRLKVSELELKEAKERMKRGDK